MREPRSLLLTREGTAFVVIDVQDRLAAAMNEEELGEALANTRNLVLGGKALGIPVLLSEQYPKGLGPTVAPLREALGEAYRPIEKLEFDCARNAGFMDELRRLDVRTVVLAGMEAHVCVLQTAVGLLEHYDVWVAQDAIVSRAHDNREAACRLMEQAGVVVAPTETILFWLLGKAGTPEFKTISQLVK